MVCQKPAIPGKHNQYKAVPLHEGGEWGTRVQNIAPLNEHAQKCVKISKSQQFLANTNSI